MPTNFTPLPKTVAHGKGAVDVNTVLIIIAIVITVILGVVMWFLIQQKENQAAVPAQPQPNVIETVPGDEEQQNQISTESAQITPQATTSATVAPTASQSAIITK